MQEKRWDGSFGEIKPMTPENMERSLKDPNVQHVEVFEATEENLKYRQRLFNRSKRFQKTGSIGKKRKR